MRYFLFIISSFTFGFYAYGQVSKIDSLTKLLMAEKTDSNRVTQLWNLAQKYQSFKPDTSLKLAQEALLLAQRIKFTEGESRSLAVLAASQYLLGNYPSALKNYVLKLKIEEKRNSPRNFASALNNIGLMYILLGEYSNALGYLHRADSTVENAGGKTKEELKKNITINIGETYYRMHIPDSAIAYFKNSLTLAKQSNDFFYLGVSMLGMANVLAQQQDNREALQYYHPSFKYLDDGVNNDMLCEVSLGMAKVFDNLNEKDSAVFFGRNSFTIAKRGGFLSRQMDAAYFLSRYFKKMKIYDSAYSYSEVGANLKDSITGQEKIKEAMIISTDEQLRQAELAEQRRKEKEARSRQLQLLVIALCILIFFLITLVISRIKIHVAAIRFMAIISLLLFFEYLILLLNPFVGEITHHNALMELLIFVGIASGLAPLHHWLEHLMISKLTKGKHHFESKFFKPKTVKLKIKK
jgi:tetratricopeptide (TPR) repeat protein